MLIRHYKNLHRASLRPNLWIRHAATFPQALSLPLVQPASRPIPKSTMPVLPADSGPFFYPWHDYVSTMKYRDVHHRLHHEIQAFAAYCQSSPEENTLYENVFHMVERVVNQNIPGARLRKSGSIVTGLALPMPDMDLVIVANSDSKAKIKKQLFALRAGLTRYGLADFNDVEVRWHAPVPIICLKTRPAYGSISVDIGVNNTDGFAVADFMNDYKVKMPAFRPLALLLKNILSNENLNDSGNHGIGSYAALCMCIHFLETNPSGRDPAMIIQPMQSESLGLLLSDLLYYYGVTFDYAKLYISPSEGKALPKEGVTWINSAWAFTVQCLFNHEKNIAASLSQVPRTRTCLQKAYAGLLRASDPTQPVLSTITGFNQAVLDHRRRIKDLHEPQTPATSRAPSRGERRMRDYDQGYNERRDGGRSSRNENPRSYSDPQFFRDDSRQTKDRISKSSRGRRPVYDSSYDDRQGRPSGSRRERDEDRPRRAQRY